LRSTTTMSPSAIPLPTRFAALIPTKYCPRLTATLLRHVWPLIVTAIGAEGPSGRPPRHVSGSRHQSRCRRNDSSLEPPLRPRMSPSVGPVFPHFRPHSPLSCRYPRKPGG